MEVMMVVVVVMEVEMVVMVMVMVMVVMMVVMMMMVMVTARAMMRLADERSSIYLVLQHNHGTLRPCGQLERRRLKSRRWR
jgi:hypothetical protein